MRIVYPFIAVEYGDPEVSCGDLSCKLDALPETIIRELTFFCNRPVLFVDACLEFESFSQVSHIQILCLNKIESIHQFVGLHVYSDEMGHLAIHGVP